MDYMGNQNGNGYMSADMAANRLGQAPVFVDPTALIAAQKAAELAPAKPGFFESLWGGAQALVESPAVQAAQKERERREAEKARKSAARQQFALTSTSLAQARAAEAAARAAEARAAAPIPKKAPIGLILGGGVIALAIIFLMRKKKK